MARVYAALDRWVGDGVIRLPKVEQAPSREEKNNPKFCKYHRRVGHPTRECWTLRRIFHEKIQSGDLILQENEAKGGGGMEKAHAMTAVAGETKSIDQAPSDRLQQLPRIKAFFDEMGFAPEARLRLTGALEQVCHDLSGKCFAASEPEGPQLEGAIAFAPEELPLLDNHNRPLYLEVEVSNCRFRRALVDCGSSVNIMPVATLDRIGWSRQRIVGQSIAIAGFGSLKQETLGYVILNLQVGPIRTPTRFHVIDAPTSYHVLLGRPWIHFHKAVPSTYFQCLKTYWRGKSITIPAADAPFEVHEAYMSEAAFFEQGAEEGETVAQLHSTELPKWEEEKGAPPSKRQRPLCERIKVNGRTVYRL